jgi:transcriptional repressor NrdR
MDTLTELAGEIERELHEQFEREVPAAAIGELVMEKLRELDQVAYIRFASVYREFTDATDFREEADTMLRDK